MMSEEMLYLQRVGLASTGISCLKKVNTPRETIRLRQFLS